MADRILVASKNKNKIRELQTVARAFEIIIVSPTEVQQEKGLDNPPAVEESADTFCGNARLKARAYAEWSGMPSLGDDSGLEVAALNLRPGVRSARYAGEYADDEQRYRKLVAELQALEKDSGSVDRRAWFRCCLVLADADKPELTSEGSLAGEILDNPRGSKGFGYDPIVLINSLGKTLAEIEFEKTCRVGFRAIAARNLFSKLKTI